MKKLIILVAALFLNLSSNAFAQNHDHKHHHGKKHSHGEVKLEMAVEKNTLEFEIEGPAESFLGFEHAPTSDKEKKIFEETKALLTTSLLTKIIVFQNNLTCTLDKIEFEQEFDEDSQTKSKDKKHKHSGQHSEIKVEGKITCPENLETKNVEVALKEQFKKIKVLEIEVMSAQVKKISSKVNKEIITL